MQNAILEGDKEEFSTFVSDEIGMITGDSNLGDFYSYSVDNLSEERNFTWNAFDLRILKLIFRLI